MFWKYIVTDYGLIKTDEGQMHQAYACINDNGEWTIYAANELQALELMAEYLCEV